GSPNWLSAQNDTGVAVERHRFLFPLTPDRGGRETRRPHCARPGAAREHLDGAIGSISRHMDVLVGALHLVSVVILVGGAAKVDAREACAGLPPSLGLPHRRVRAQLAGVIEIVLGATALVVGGRWGAAAVAIAYGVFAVVVLLARRSGAASCGCF